MFPRDTLALNATPIVRVRKPESHPHCDNSLSLIIASDALRNDPTFGVLFSENHIPWHKRFRELTGQ